MYINPDDAVAWYVLTVKGAKRLAELSKKSYGYVVDHCSPLSDDLDEVAFNEEDNYYEEACDAYVGYLTNQGRRYEYVF